MWCEWWWDWCGAGVAVNMMVVLMGLLVTSEQELVTWMLLVVMFLCLTLASVSDGAEDGDSGDETVGDDSTGAGGVDGTDDRIVASDGDVKVQFHLIWCTWNDATAGDDSTEIDGAVDDVGAGAGDVNVGDDVTVSVSSCLLIVMRVVMVI